MEISEQDTVAKEGEAHESGKAFVAFFAVPVQLLGESGSQSIPALLVVLNRCEEF